MHGTHPDMQIPPVPRRRLPFHSLLEPAGDHLHILAFFARTHP
jgi:hypothetical protein